MNTIKSLLETYECFQEKYVPVSYRKSFYRTDRIKNIVRVSYRTDKILFFGEKMLQRQKVSVKVYLGIKKSGCQFINTKNLKVRLKKKCSPLHNKEKFCIKNCFGDKIFYRIIFLLESIRWKESFSNRRLT